MPYLIGKQGISYQGTQETASNGDTLWNSGIFLAIARQVTHCYLLLYEHIHSPLQKDISYMSPASQNKLIDVAAKYIIVCVCVCVAVFGNMYIYMLMKQWWLITQLKTLLRSDTSGFACFFFQTICFTLRYCLMKTDGEILSILSCWSEYPTSYLTPPLKSTLRSCTSTHFQVLLFKIGSKLQEKTCVVAKKLTYEFVYSFVLMILLLL